MEIRQIEAFVAVAEELNFRRAAMRLHIAQPRLSQIIRQLEHELGVKLFERTTRSVRLTEPGQLLLEHGLRLLDDVASTEAAVRGAGTGETGTVRIGYGGITYSRIIPEIIHEIQREHPGLNLRLESNLFSGKAFDKVSDRSIDVGFGRLPGLRAGVRHRVVAHEHLVVALAADHPLAGSQRVRIAELAHEQFVAPPGDQGSSVRDYLVQACLNAGFAPRVTQEAPDNVTLLSLVAARLGIALTLSTLEPFLPEGVVFRPLEPHVAVPAVVLWHAADESRSTQAVLAIVERILPSPAPA